MSSPIPNWNCTLPARGPSSGRPTFAVSADAPVYVVRAHPGMPYEPGSLCANPYGTWYLAPRASGGLH